MKKSIVSLIIFCLLSVCCFELISLLPQTLFVSADSYDFFDFKEDLLEITSKDEVEYTYIDKDGDNQSFINILSNEGCNVKTDDIILHQKLTTKSINQICQDNDYVVEEQENQYKIHNKFFLKRLLVNGTINDDYGANKVVSGYKDYNILCYDTIEETKYAFEKYSQQEDLNVIYDSIFTLDDTIEDITTQNNTQPSASASDYVTWGYDALDIDTYNDYLDEHGIDKEVVVAVLDTGINTSHFKFQDRILTDKNGNLVGDTYYDTTYTYSGYNFEDDDGHGTHISGTIVDLTPSNVKILPIKVLGINEEGKTEGNTLNTVFALESLSVYLEKYNIVSVNLSLGTVGVMEDYVYEFVKNEYDNAFNMLREKGVVSVAAAGNEQDDVKNHAPACCDETCLVVSALMQSGSTYVVDSRYSNYGATVDISAPGTGIWAAYINDTNSYPTDGLYNFAKLNGTSMATPHVAAVVALLTLDSRYYDGDGNPTYTVDEIEERLLGCTIDLGDEGKDIYYGEGMLNLKNHLSSMINYSVEDCTTTYDGQFHNIKIEIQSEIECVITYGFTEENITISDITTSNKFKNFTNGKIPIYFKITASDYYTEIGFAYLNILQKELTATIQDQKFTYGSVDFDSTKYTISGNIVEGDNLNFSLTTTATSTSGVGDYDILLNYSNSNYKITNTKAKLTITPKILTATVQDQSFTYGDVKFDDTKYTLSGSLVPGDSLNVVLTTTATNTSPVGNYDITFSCDNDNYTISHTKGTLSIIPRDISITLTSQSLVYGNNISLNSNAYQIISGKIVNNDKLGLVLTTNYKYQDDVGENYVISYSNHTNKNYSITATPGSLKVTQRPITINLLNQSSMYGDEIVVDNTKFSLANNSLSVIEGDDLGIKLKTDATVQIGKYTISLDSVDNKNYNVTAIEGEYEVTVRFITVTIEDQTFVFGTNFKFDKTKFSITSGSVLPSDDLKMSISCDVSSASPVGNYDIQFSWNENDNYKLNVIGGKVYIQSQLIKVSIALQKFVYGDEISLDDVTYTVQNQPSNFDFEITFTTQATKESDVGQYPINAECSNTNFDVEITVNDHLQIVEREVTIKAVYSSVYGDNIVFDNKYTVVNGNVVNNDDLGLKFNTSATNRSSVGDYKITKTHTNTNYIVTLSNDSILTITARPVELSLSIQTGVYGDRVKLNQNGYVVVRGLISGDDLQVSLVTSASHLSNSGRYPISAKIGNKNYTLYNTKNADFIVTKRPIVIQLQHQKIPFSFKLDYNEKAFDVIEGSIVNNDDLNLTMYSDAKIYSMVGEFDLTAEADNSNYEVTILSGTVEIVFSFLAFIVIVAPVIIITGLGITIYFVKRRKKFNKFLKED